MYDIVTFGELLIDFSPAGLSANNQVLFERNPGGAPANVASALSKLGKSAAFIGKVGNDQFGVYLKGVLDEIHVDTKGLVMSDDYDTTLAFVHLDEDGDRSFSFYRKSGADVMIETSEIDYSIIDASRIFHFGSVSMTDEPARQSTLEAANYAKQQGKIVSYDPNLRMPLWKSEEEAKVTILSAMTYADILKVSEEELFFLTGIEDLEKGAQQFIDEYDIKIVLITLGPNGSFIKTSDYSILQPGLKVKAIDTTGAGDAFTGGFLYQIIEKDKEFDALTTEDLKGCLQFANATGALTTTKIGAIPALPSRVDIEECLKKEQN